MEDVPNDTNSTEQHDRCEAIATPTQEGGTATLSEMTF